MRNAAGLGGTDFAARKGGRDEDLLEPERRLLVRLLADFSTRIFGGGIVYSHKKEAPSLYLNLILVAMPVPRSRRRKCRRSKC